MTTKKYPVSDCPSRPFHLWDENKSKRFPYRYYGDKIRAHDYAMHVARWDLKVGQTIAVLDVSKGKCLGQYTRRVNDIQFRE